MPDPDPDRLPTSADPSGRCPRCGNLSNFAPGMTQAIAFAEGQLAPPPGSNRSGS